jgi:hypothetical protein
MLKPPVYLVKKRLTTTTYFGPKLMKMKRGTKNKNQRASTFFLAYLSNIVHNKILLNPLLVQNKCTTFYFRKTERT